MIKDGATPSRILAFTFTKKAANELQERVRNAVGVDADRIFISTYHSFCGRMLRGCAEYAGRTSNFSIYDEDDKKKVLNEIIKEYFKGIGTSEALKYGMVASYISKYKTDNLSPSEAKIKRAPKSSYDKACCFIYEAYENAMRDLNAFDFDDLPFFAYRITKANPEILDAIASRFDYVLADENQDSNHQNLDFILLLGSKSENIIMVGDTDQSIYKFRGADVANVIDVVKVENFNTKFLSINYRSTKTIVDAANEVIKHNKKRIEKVPSSNNEEGEKIDLIFTRNNATEADYICKKIKSMKEKYPELTNGDFAILTRTQNQIKLLEETFLEHHIPFISKGIVPFYCRTEVKDIIAFIKYAMNDKDMVSFSRIINVPKRGIGATSLKKLTEELSKTSMNDIIKGGVLKLKQLGLNKNGQAGFNDFVRLIYSIREMMQNDSSPESIIKYIVESIDYYQYLEDDVEVESTLEDKKSNIKELIHIAATYTNIFEFLNSATIDDPNVELEVVQELDKVNIMTMHSSKGLEFRIVFIIGAHDECTPFIRSHDDPDDVEEERRLFYVAMTRAKKKLMITCPRVVTGYMDIQKSVKPSRFLKEIPDKYLNKYQF